MSHIHSSISNWRFLFIIECVPTALLAAACWFFLPDRPEKARFLNSREREIATAFARSQPGGFEKPGFHPKQLLDALKDYRSKSSPPSGQTLKAMLTYPQDWIFGLINFSTNVSFASLPLFLPTIIEDLGAFDALQSNGLSAPPYLLCFIVMIITTFVSDKVAVRGPFACAFALVASIGYLILANTSDVAPRYAGIFLVVLIFTTVAIILVWNANSNENESKRAGGVWIVSVPSFAVDIGLVADTCSQIQTVGQCGTVLGTNMFPDSTAPYYRRGMWIGFSFSMLAAVGCATLSFLFWRENRRRDLLYGKVDRVAESMDHGEQPMNTEATVRYII